ncbi:MAG: thioesterase family protein [Acidimicrobiia bacterium]|nr:thioesterase family protein [Acidimicrobiia bacterium]
MSPGRSNDNAAYPHPADLALIKPKLGPDGDRGSFELVSELCRFDGALYGGTGIAVSVMAMEAATQRDAVWVVTQFVASTQAGARIEWETQELAAGHRVSQLSVVARSEGATMFCALGATADPRPDGLDGQFLPMPKVTPPDESPPLMIGPGTPALRDKGFNRNLEYREAEPLEGRDGHAVLLWARRTDGSPLTRAGIAYLADMVPMAIARAAGKFGAGFSLDNALRFATVPPEEWVLLDLRGELASLGYGHGSLTAWTTDGTLVATGSQSAMMKAMFDLDDDAAVARWEAAIEAMLSR